MALKKFVRYNEVGSMWELLIPSGGRTVPLTVLVKGSWLVRLADEGGRLPRRQDLPAEAKWDGQELIKDSEEYDEGREREAHKVIAVSYCWFHPEHPDPHGEQLRVIAELVRSRLEDLGPGTGVDLAVFIDYCGLYQEPRTVEEDAVFQASINHTFLWYAHKKTQVWVLPSTPSTCSLKPGAPALPVLPFEERGWPRFERKIAELLACEGGAGQSVLLIDDEAKDKLLGDEKLEWVDILNEFKSDQDAPAQPAAFQSALAATTFSTPSDLPVLQGIYATTFEDVMSSIRTLVYCDLGWGDRAAAELSNAVKDCILLTSIELEGNDIADDGCEPLMAAFTKCRDLAHITLRSNRIGDKGARHIAAALPQLQHMQDLDLSFNKIGNAGAGDFVNMFEAHGRHPSLQELRLNNNTVGSALKHRLKDAASAAMGEDLELHL